MTSKVFRQGILGGTFNPVHQGHLHLAKVAMVALRLDELLFIPSSSPPHKRGLELCDFKHRVAMLEMAVAPYSEFQVSCVEAERPGFSYTIDTVRTLHAHLTNSAELIFLMGFDAFQEMGTWKDYVHIPQYTTIAVCERDGDDIAAVAQDLFGSLAPIQEFSVPEKKVSSSMVRQILQTGRHGAESLLPHDVLGYINKYGLYLKDK